MEVKGYEASKNYLELKYKHGQIEREELNKRLKQLRNNFKNGTARKEMETAGHKDYMRY